MFLRRARLAAVIAAAGIVAAAPAFAATPRRSLDVEAAQAILAVQGLDGWLLAQAHNQNPIAADLVNPGAATFHPWFYYVPAAGAPVALVHKTDLAAFDDVPGKKIDYGSDRDLKAGLRTVLHGGRRVAMEYAPKSSIPSLSRVNASTISLLRSLGVRVSSSAELVQFTKSLWGPDGRVAHYVAIHHLARLKDAALAHVAAELRAGHTINEYELQQFLVHGYGVRGIDGPPPVVASGAHTADPRYSPTAASAVEIKGDLLLLDLSGRVSDAGRPIFARLSWVAYVGDSVPDRLAGTFKQVAAARDAALSLVEERAGRKQVIKGYEVDAKARARMAQAGLRDQFLHPTGHSLDTSLLGDGANLDDLETHDTRNLVMGSGFTIGPGAYARGELGMRSIIDVYLGRQGVEVTSPQQQQITAVLAR